MSINNVFAEPERGFVSRQAAGSWQDGLLTGNGTIGAVVPGHPFDEMLHLSHAGLFLPNPQSPVPVKMVSRLDKLRRLCLEGRFREAGEEIEDARSACNFSEERDRFVAAFAMNIRQAEGEIMHYQRSVDFLTAEAKVMLQYSSGASFTRTIFASRASNVLVLRLLGNQPLCVELSFKTVPTTNEKEKSVLDRGIRQINQGVLDNHLSYRSLFAYTNADNPLGGYQGLGRVVAIGGGTKVTTQGIRVRDADEILVIVAIKLLRHDEDLSRHATAIVSTLAALPADYAALLEPHRRIHSELMGRVRLQLDAPEADRRKTSEDLLSGMSDSSPSLAQIERAFDAGRYNIICSTGYNPPHLQGLWSGTWLAPWYGSFTTNGNLQSAIAFLLMGNTPELMDAFFRFFDARWDGFRANARNFFDMPGFHVPAQLTVSPRATNFSSRYPHCFWHAGAAWILQFYYDYFQYTGDTVFLATHTYPLMKEAASFYEAFLSVKDDNGRLVFAPSYSPENSPGTSNCPTAINSTMDVAACRQLLKNCIAAAEHLDCDKEERKRWADLIGTLPDYEVDSDGYFREWLWPGLAENHQHRHASHLYPLYDEMPADILERPELVSAVAKSIRKRLNHHRNHPVMAFGLVQIGLAASRIGRNDLAEEAIQLLAKHYWSTAMGSLHNRGDLFNTDISGGFPYLCTSTLVYADPGRIVFFPALPASWPCGQLSGIRLRGSITLLELSWSYEEACATLVSDIDQTIRIEVNTQAVQTVSLNSGKIKSIRLSLNFAFIASKT